MHLVPTGRPLATWVDDAINWARVIYLEHDKQEADWGMFAPMWSQPIGQRLPCSWPRITSQYPPEIVSHLARLRPGAVALAMLNKPPSDLGVEYRALKRSQETEPPRPRIKYLETAAQIFAFADSVDDSVWDEAATWALDNPNATVEGVQDIYSAWISGDVESALSAGTLHGVTRFPPIKHAELTSRNLLWLPTIRELVRSAREPTLVLVGAAHLGGPDGLISQLAAGGLMLTGLQSLTQ
jgi:uncharacterized protein YbaP (TraB family)